MSDYPEQAGVPTPPEELSAVEDPGCSADRLALRVWLVCCFLLWLTACSGFIARP